MKLYLPIEPLTLYRYVHDVFIYPIKYDYRFYDRESIQKRFPNYILLSKIKWIEGCNVSVEVEIDENRLIQLDDNFYLYDDIITFDKVQTIWFDDIEYMDIFIFNLEISTTFTPKHLMKVDENIESYFSQNNYRKEGKFRDHLRIDLLVEIFEKS